MKKSLLSGMLLSGAALLLAGKSRNSKVRRRELADQPARRYITYAVLPAWPISGFLDWLWHRQTNIETTSGTEESITHLLMVTEAGLPIMLAMFLEINSGVLALMMGGWLLHQLTAYIDIAYTVSRRVIPPREQQTHLFMQTIPFDILAIMACLYPEQFKALLGMGKEKRSFSLCFKRPGMSPVKGA